MRVLIVEDEIHLAETLRQLMLELYFQSDVVHSGTDGLGHGLAGQYDLILLDAMLPELNGFQVARQLRDARISTPILMLTARDDAADKISSLDCGADDCMTKPFDAGELQARARALTRRQGEISGNVLTLGDLSLDCGSHTLSCGARSVRPGFKEFEIMRLLLLSRGRVIAKDTLITKVWGPGSKAEDNNVEVYISFLRKKLAFVGSKVSINTVRNIGYKLEAQGDPS